MIQAPWGPISPAGGYAKSESVILVLQSIFYSDISKPKGAHCATMLQ